MSTVVEPSAMSETLTTRISTLVDMGWRVESHTATTAALTTRAPFNWWLFALLTILLFGIGALSYIVYWLVASPKHIFLTARHDEVTVSGDTWLVQQQERDREKWIQKQREIQERGFFRVMWPVILAWFAAIALWFVWVWLFISIRT